MEMNTTYKLNCRQFPCGSVKTSRTKVYVKKDTLVINWYQMKLNEARMT